MRQNAIRKGCALPGHPHSGSIEVPYRENNSNANRPQAGFLTRTLPQKSFPSALADSGKLPAGFRLLGAGAHSGATVAEFHRVPFAYPKARPSDLRPLYFDFKRALTKVLATANRPRKGNPRKIFHHFARLASPTTVSTQTRQIPSEMRNSHTKRRF
jgi:hypothetical protein